MRVLPSSKNAERSYYFLQLFLGITFSLSPGCSIRGRGGEGGGGSPKTSQPDGGWKMPSFIGGKSRGPFGEPEPAFFLAGNRMTTVAFEIEFFFKP